MKKIILFSVIAVMLCSCGKKANLKPLLPNEILSETQIEEAVNNEYDLVLDKGSIISMGGDVYKTVYVSEPLGAHDAVTVKIHQPQKDSDAVKNIYTDGYESRTKKHDIDGLGEMAYIAFPTVHIYHCGYLVEITAGSGDSQEQTDLLLALGRKAVENLDAYYEK